MQPPEKTRARPGRPSQLSQDVIVEAAQRILDEEGHEQLSMRRLARELSITPMALYHHVRDKHDLLLLLLAVKSAAFPHPELPDDPVERTVAAGRLLYDVLAECPFLADILASPDLMSVSVSWVAEVLVNAAVECGLTPAQALGAYNVIWRYTLGTLMIHLNHRGGPTDPDVHDERRLQTMSALDPVDYPRITALAPRWPELTNRNPHDQGLRDVVGGLLHHYKRKM
ncbi:TetR/AcrR family transcriptional regulator [Kitasatospora sp. NPDC048286]|uniref:TetR/AcrR family transcriptional regulator n=1 Tax=Kitasatospora sp. NPDC048286 TaxID=3364047 RepID=UPI00371347E3